MSMKSNTLVVVFVLVMALAPVFLALNQGVPAGSLYKQAVLLLSLAAFGSVLGQFWLSRLFRGGGTVKSGRQRCSTGTRSSATRPAGFCSSILF